MKFSRTGSQRIFIILRLKLKFCGGVSAETPPLCILPPKICTNFQMEVPATFTLALNQPDSSGWELGTPSHFVFGSARAPNLRSLRSLKNGCPKATVFSHIKGAILFPLSPAFCLGSKTAFLYIHRFSLRHSSCPDLDFRIADTSKQAFRQLLR